MAFLPGIFNRQQPAQQPAQPQAPQVNSNGSAGPAGNQTQMPANTAAHPTNMAGGQAAPAAGGPQPAAPTGLDAFTNLFTPKAQDPNATKAPTLADPILGALDPAAFRQQISTANFAASIPQDTIQKAMQGDAQAFQDALNHASREAFAAAAQLSHGLVENGVRTGADRLNSTLDSRFRNLQLKSQNTNNEALNHPAVAPMLQGVKMMIAQNNPNLSPTEVQQQAEAYFEQMAGVLAKPQQVQQQESNAPKQPDFSSYLN